MRIAVNDSVGIALDFPLLLANLCQDRLLAFVQLFISKRLAVIKTGVVLFHGR